MSDWQKTQYRLTPKPDPLAEVEDFKFGVGGWAVIAVFVACVIGLVLAFL
jgi:hypothetical protein